MKVVQLEGKGWGVVSSNFITKGTFICEYAGRLLSKKEAITEERMYEADETIGCYMYYFTFRGEQYW